ncbi:MAG: IclR family transcriptional regulator, partial [Betaproteobacteria bacterium]
ESALGHAMLSVRSARSRVTAAIPTLHHPGFWIDERSSTLQSRCIAAPIANAAGHAAAAVGIFASGIRWTTERLRAELAPIVVGAAAEINAIAFLSGESQGVLSSRTKLTRSATMPPVGEKSRYHIEALARGLRVIQAFSIGENRLSVPLIAQMTGLQVSSVFRIVRTLVEAGYVHRVSDRNEYALTLRALDLGYSAVTGASFVEIASHKLQSLREEYGGMTFISVLAGHESVDVAKFVGQERSVHGPIRYPLYATAGGKVLLANTTGMARSLIIKELEFIPHSAHTIRNEAELLDDLEKVRERGYAVNNEELHPGRWAVAAPVFDSRERSVAALGIMLDTDTVADPLRKDEIIGRVCLTAQIVSLKLGYLFA